MNHLGSAGGYHKATMTNNSKPKITMRRLSILFTSVISVGAIIPPHPDTVQNSTWIPVHQYRRNLGVNYNYHPTLLSPELCRFENETACQDMDEGLQNHAHRTLQMIKNTGKLNVLVILMQFSDHEERPLVDFMDLDRLFNSEGKGGKVVPTGSVKSFFRLNSHGALTMDATILPWFRVPYTEEYCTHGKNGMSIEFQKCFWPILNALDSLHLDSAHPFTWEDYDQNRDGFLDNLVVMHSGYGAEWGGLDPDGKDKANRIWSHAIGTQSNRWQSKYFFVDLGAYSVTSAFSGHTGENAARIGIVAHEMLHTFGIPDLFDVSGKGAGLGSYSTMSDAWGQGGDATYPGHLDPWSKVKLGWVQPIPIVSRGEYSMMPSESEPDIYIIDDPYPDGEYLLIENRQQLHYDTKLWATGALIYHIDDHVFMNKNPGGPYQDGWPENGNHYQVALLQADGLYELEQNTNKGENDDFFINDQDSLGPGNARSVYPNTDSYQGGNVIPTNIQIGNFRLIGLKMSFTVKGLPEPTPTSPPITPLAPPTMPDPMPATTSECIVNVNVQLCSDHIQNVIPQDGCDCHNFCGNGQVQECCKFGEACNIDCPVGGLIAGCVVGSNSDTRVVPTQDEFLKALTPDADIFVEAAAGGELPMRSPAAMTELRWFPVLLLIAYWMQQ